MRMISLRTTVSLASALVLVAACNKEPAADGNTTASAGSTGQAMADMPGMSGGGAMEQMQSHMGMMQGASGDSMKAMLPMHRQMLGNMLSQFDKDMSGMNMSSDAAWKALTDSLRQDNTRLGDMSANDVRSVMPAHLARINRLITMHHAMMGKK